MKKCIVVAIAVALMCFTSAFVGCAKKPAEFVYSDLVLKPPEAEVWQEVTATANIKNIGQLEGVSKASLKINGQELQTKDVTLAGGSSGTATFTFKRDEGPKCAVEINGLTKDMVVKEGILPVLTVGDKRVFKWAIDTFEYTVTMEVTGEDVTNGKNCYVVQATFEPAFQGIITNATIKYEKTTMQEVKTQLSGKVNDIPFISSTTHSHEISGSPLYPTVVGMESRVTTTENTTTTAAGQSQTQSAKRIDVSKVEKIEDITVPAGTFRCFKTVKYDEKGKVTSTSWASDKAKIGIKTEDSASGGMKITLMSYSVY